MKKYLNLSWCLLLVLGFSSCEVEDDEIRDEPVDIGGYAVLSDDHVTVFDTNEDLTVEIFTDEGVTAETVEIVQDGTVIGTATVSGETATFNTSIFGAFEFEDDDGVIHSTGSFPIRIRTTYSNGQVSEDPYSVSVDHAITLGDNPTETTMDSLSTRVLEYEVSTFGATVDAVTLSVKEGSEGTYQDTALDLSTEGGAVEISEIDLAGLGIDLSVNDTLYYQFTASSGTLTDAASSYLAVVPKDFQTSSSATLSNDLSANQLNLATGEVTADGTAGADIVFDGTILGPGFSATGDTDIQFVQVTDPDFWATVDVLNAKEAYESGTPVSTITSVEEGDVVVYKVTRDVFDEDGEFVETQVFYGALRIGDVTIINDEVVNFEVEAMEGR